MKSIISLLTISSLMLGLGACSKDSTPNIPVKSSAVKVGRFPHSLSFGQTHDQLFVSCYPDQTIAEVDLTKGSVINEFSVLPGPSQLILDKAFNRVYALHNKQNGFALIQLSPSKLIRNDKTGSLNLAGGAIRPNSRELWISDGQTKLLIFTRGLALKKNINVGRYPQAITFAQDGQQALVALKGENAIAVINPNSYELIRKIQVGIYPRDMLVVGNKVFVSNYGSDEISVIDLNQNKEVNRIPVAKRPGALAVHGHTLWVACQKSFYLMAIDVNQEKVIGRARTGFFPGDLLAKNDGTLIVTSPRDEKIAIIHVQDNTPAGP